MQEIMLGFGECEAAENGSQAIAIFQRAVDTKENFDFVLLDIMMPEMDGQQVLEKFRAIEYDAGIKGLDTCKIVMTTALDDFDNIKTAFRNQAEGYIVKPIDKDKVVKVLEDLKIKDS